MFKKEKEQNEQIILQNLFFLSPSPLEKGFILIILWRR